MGGFCYAKIFREFFKPCFEEFLLNYSQNSLFEISKVQIGYVNGIFEQKSEISMKKFLFSVGLALTIAISVSNISFAEELQYYDIKPANEQQTTVKRCPCKKHFVEHLGLTNEQVKF